ncbi:MAG: CDP-glycerol glycerophosphotransferase family protein [Lachnospiraceae bacterium]|nr:CDP-glycerol glycerophosphotransferase family protein [Lachnospiraceae bacterium]
MQYTVSELERKTRKKSIVCFGAGNNLTYVFHAISDLQLEKRVKYIVDNDETKWGTQRNINGKSLEIKCPKEILKEKRNDILLVITIINYISIMEQIESLVADLTGLEVTLSPLFRNSYDKYFDRLFKKLPMKKTIILQGEGDTCENAVALAKYMRSQTAYKDVKLGWLCNHPDKFKKTKSDTYILRDLPSKKHSIMEAIRYFNLINRSYMYIYENKMLPKARKEQISCYMNHGTPIKSTKGKITVYPDTDFVLSSSTNINGIFIEQYKALEEQIVICGSPRTDVLYNDDIHQELAKYLKISQYRKIVLWAPTFRTMIGNSRSDSTMKFTYGVPLIESDEDILELMELLRKEKILLIIKPHLYQELSELLLKENENIKIIKQNMLDDLNANVYDLMKLTDCMITDYSSIAFDYLILDRPLGYTLDDIEQYTIGFAVDNPLEYMPGRHLKSVKDMCLFLMETCDGKDLFYKERRQLRKYMLQYDDGKSSERLLNILGI